MNNKKYETPFSSVGYITYKRTYARRLDENDINSPTEEFPDTVERVIQSANNQLGVGFTADEQERLRGYLLGLKGSVAGRFWWQMGTKTVDRLGLSSLQNCFSGDTEIITSNGQKALADLVGKDGIKVWAKGAWHDATVRSFGRQSLQQVTFVGDAGTRVYNVTPNHRWELVDGSTTVDLRVGQSVPGSSPDADLGPFTVESIRPLGEDEVFCAVVPGIERFTLAGDVLTSNCAFTVIDEPVRPFTWAMDMLMLGSGVGYNIQRKNIDKLPMVNESFKAPVRTDTPDADFIVPDTREGWVALLGKTLKAAFLAHKTGKQTFTFSTLLIRGKGAPIKGFGGTASGPEDLCWGIGEISKILENRAGRKLRPIDALDIMNIIGAVVVAGNVRRCLVGDTLVMMADGTEKEIKDIVPGDRISIAGEVHDVPNVFDNGVQPVVSVVLEDGSSFECTENHRWYVYNNDTNVLEWRTTSELSSGNFSMVSPE